MSTRHSSRDLETNYCSGPFCTGLVCCPRGQHSFGDNCRKLAAKTQTLKTHLSSSEWRRALFISIRFISIHFTYYYFKYYFVWYELFATLSVMSRIERSYEKS